MFLPNKHNKNRVSLSDGLSGIKTPSTVLLDIDGTVISDGETTVCESVFGLIRDLVVRGNDVVLVSNSRRPGRVESIANQLGVRYVLSSMKKPNKKLLLDIDFDKSNRLVVVGDKFCTDGLFARRCGAEFVHVKRKTDRKDRISILIGYYLDDMLWRVASLFFR